MWIGYPCINKVYVIKTQYVQTNWIWSYFLVVLPHICLYRTVCKNSLALSEFRTFSQVHSYLLLWTLSWIIISTELPYNTIENHSVIFTWATIDRSWLYNAKNLLRRYCLNEWICEWINEDRVNYIAQVDNSTCK
jgi:hypothetical protein